MGRFLRQGRGKPEALRFPRIGLFLTSNPKPFPTRSWLASVRNFQRFRPIGKISWPWCLKAFAGWKGELRRVKRDPRDLHASDPGRAAVFGITEQRMPFASQMPADLMP